MTHLRLSWLMVLVLVTQACTAIVDAGSYKVVSDAGTDASMMIDAGPGEVMDAARDATAEDTGTDTGSPVDVDAGGEEPDATMPTPDLEKLGELGRALANWACVNLSRCESQAGAGASDAVRALLIRLCHPRAVERTQLAQWESLVAAGDVAFDESKVAGCVEALKPIDIRCDADLMATGLSECEGVLTGRGEPDSACAGDLRCAPGTICAGDTAYCDGSCRAPGTQGQACADNTDCGANFVCLADICIARAGVALPCGSDAECRDGLYCAADSKCAAQAGMDEPCVAGRPESCAGDLVCVQPMDQAMPAVCGAGVGLGAMCSTNRPCTLGGRCVSGTCVPVAIPGGSCNSDAQCPLGLYCAPNGCQPKPVLGEACDEGAGASPRKECIEGVCTDGTCTLGTEGATCRFELAVPFDACTGYCNAAGSCVDGTKIAGAECAGDYECAATLSCVATMDGSATMTCQSPQC